MAKLIRITTVPLSLRLLLRGQMRYLRSKGFTVWMASADGCEVRELEKAEGCPHLSLPLTRRITPCQDLWALWTTYRLFRRLRPDLIHSHSPKAGLIGMVAGWMARVPIRLHTVAGLPLMESRGLRKRLLVNLEKLTYCCATRVYPNSLSLSLYIQRNIYRKGSKLQVIGHGSTNGIDCRYFRRTAGLARRARMLRSEAGIGSSAFVWIYIGRIVSQKGINELVNAFSHLSEQTSGSVLWLVGSYEPELDPLSRHTQVLIDSRQNIIVTAFQQDVRPFLLAADALVFPSYREGFPNVPMQAACLAVPMIVTDINGCNEIVTHEKNGLLVRPKDSQALLKAMERLQTDALLRFRLGRAARRGMEERYDQQRMWEHYYQEYQRLLTGAGR